MRWIVRSLICFVCCGMTPAQNTVVNGKPAPNTRNVLLKPFSSKSIWNVPIGSGATYVAANMPTVPNSTVDDDEIFIFTPSAPLTQVAYNAAGWTGGDRCNFTTYPITNAGNIGADGSGSNKVPVPNNYLLLDSVPANTPNNSGAILLQDGQTLSQFQPVQRCTTSGVIIYTDQFGVGGSIFPNGNLYTDGLAGSHGGSGLSALGGTIRIGELVPGNSPIVHGVKDVIRHVLKFEYNAQFNSFGTGPFWPANSADTGNEGLLVALLPTFNFNGLKTAPARSIAWTLINYGAYLVDTPGWDAVSICFEQSTFDAVNGVQQNSASNFAKNWGFTVYCDQCGNAFSQDMQTISAALQVITNNSASCSPYACGPAGGGKGRQPLLSPVAKP